MSDNFLDRIEKLENRVARLEAVGEGFPNYRRSIEEELEGLQGWCRQLQEHVDRLEAELRKPRRTGPPVWTGPPDYRLSVPNIPIPKDNTRSIEEILAVVQETRDWIKRMKIT